MISYRDKSFCGSKVKKHTCGREFTKADAKAAEKWWGNKDYPVAYTPFCEEPTNTTTPEKEVIVTITLSRGKNVLLSQVNPLSDGEMRYISGDMPTVAKSGKDKDGEYSVFFWGYRFIPNLEIIRD